MEDRNISPLQQYNLGETAQAVSLEVLVNALGRVNIEKGQDAEESAPVAPSAPGLERSAAAKIDQEGGAGDGSDDDMPDEVAEEEVDEVDETPSTVKPGLVDLQKLCDLLGMDPEYKSVLADVPGGMTLTLVRDLHHSAAASLAESYPSLFDSSKIQLPVAGEADRSQLYSLISTGEISELRTAVEGFLELKPVLMQADDSADEDDGKLRPGVRVFVKNKIQVKRGEEKVELGDGTVTRMVGDTHIEIVFDRFPASPKMLSLELVHPEVLGGDALQSGRGRSYHDESVLNGFAETFLETLDSLAPSLKLPYDRNRASEDVLADLDLQRSINAGLTGVQQKLSQAMSTAVKRGLSSKISFVDVAEEEGAEEEDEQKEYDSDLPETKAKLEKILGKSKMPDMLTVRTYNLLMDHLNANPVPWNVSGKGSSKNFRIPRILANAMGGYLQPGE